MATDDITHRVRASVFAQEAEWRLEGDRLIWREATDSNSARSGMIALDQVESLRLTREPTRGGTRMFCRVRTRDGTAAHIASAHYAGVLRNEDRSASYKDLVCELIARLAAVNPRVRFLAGATRPVWWGVALGIAALFGALGALFAIAGREMFTIRLIAGLALVAFGAPNLIRWLKSNRPGTFDPANPPI